MSKKKEWTRTEVLELISSYEEHPCLWNVHCKEYKNKIKKSQAIKQLSEQFITSPEEISRKLHNLRNQFNTELKKIDSKKSGQGDENYVSKWPLFKSLLFIKTSLLTRRTIIRNMSTEDGDSEVGEDFETGNEYNCTVSDLSRKRQESSQFVKKMKVDDREHLLARARDALSNDEWDIFGSFVAGELRQLRHDFLKRKLKRGIQQLILEISEEDE